MSTTFEWDPHKAELNLSKHGISFEEASTVFTDPVAVTAYDPDHSRNENRYLTMGMSREGQLLIVAHTDRGDRVRVINARRATRSERINYEEGP